MSVETKEFPIDMLLHQGHSVTSWTIAQVKAMLVKRDAEVAKLKAKSGELEHALKHAQAKLTEAERKLAAIYSTEPLERVGVFTSAVTPDTYGRPLQPLIPKPTKEQT